MHALKTGQAPTGGKTRRVDDDSDESGTDEEDDDTSATNTDTEDES
jgi:translocation protein SEC63